MSRDKELVGVGNPTHQVLDGVSGMTVMLSLGTDAAPGVTWLASWLGRAPDQKSWVCVCEHVGPDGGDINGDWA